MTPWLRLWSDMPNDPKWRTISKLSGQPITSVICVYLHLLVHASNASVRGTLDSLSSEDIASALDLDEAQVTAVLQAMQGRVLDGARLTGWDKRQPKREDGAADRAKAWRESKMEKGERNRTQSNASERKKSKANADEPPEESRGEKIRRGEGASAVAPAGAHPPFSDKFREFIASERPDIKNAETVFANFCDYKPSRQRTMANWRIWVRSEHRGKEQPSPVNDPDSRASVEAEAQAKGLKPWDQMQQWAAYLAYVRGSPGGAL